MILNYQCEARVTSRAYPGDPVTGLQCKNDSLNATFRGRLVCGHCMALMISDPSRVTFSPYDIGTPGERIEKWKRAIRAIVRTNGGMVIDAEVSDFAAAVASGDPLAALAEMVGLERALDESDAEFRARIERAKL